MVHSFDDEEGQRNLADPKSPLLVTASQHLMAISQERGMEGGAGLDFLDYLLHKKKYGAVRPTLKVSVRMN